MYLDYYYPNEFENDSLIFGGGFMYLMGFFMVLSAVPVMLCVPNQLTSKISPLTRLIISQFSR